MESANGGLAAGKEARERWSYLVALLGTTKDGQWDLTEGQTRHVGSAVWQRLNELGAYGWELVAVVPVVGSEKKIELMAIDPHYATKTTGQWLWFKKKS